VSVTLLGKSAASLGIQTVTLLANDQTFGSVPLRAARQQLHFVVDTTGQDRGELCIAVKSSTVRPPGDNRRLGVPIERLTLQRLPGGGIDSPLLIQLIALLVLASGGLWLLRTAGAAPWAAALAIAVGSTALAIGMTSGRLIGGIGMTRNLLQLAGASTLLLFGEIGTRHINRSMLGLPASSRRQLAHDLAAMLFWSVLLVATVWWMQVLQDSKGFWPIKGGVQIVFTPWVLLPIALFGVWLEIILRLLARARSDRPCAAAGCARCRRAAGDSEDRYARHRLGVLHVPR
jgi:hypothetical protein